MWRGVLGREPAMREINSSVGQLPDRSRMRHHQDCVAFGMQFAQQFQDDSLIRFIEISR